MDNCITNNITVSWLCCTNNVDDRTYLTIDSCIYQTYHNYVIILVLNGDNLDYKEQLIVQKYGHSKFIKIVKSNLIGLASNLNIGLFFCETEFVARIDNGDTSSPQRLEKQLSRFLKNDKLVVLGSNYNLVDGDNFIKKINLPLTNNKIRKLLLIKNPLCHPSVMFRTEFIKKNGGYPNLKFAQDYALWRELSRNQNIEFENLEEALVNYSYESETNSRYNEENYRIIFVIYLTEFFYKLNVFKIITKIKKLIKRK